MPERGRLWVAFERLTRTALPQVDFCAQYPGNVIAQNGQTFDFQPDSPKLPGITGLGFYSGSPGITFTLDFSQQPRAVLFFAGYSPAGAALSCWGNPGLSTLAIAGSGPAAARATDPVEPNTLMTAWMQAVVTGLAGNTGAPITIPTPPNPFGTIQSGSTVVTIGG